MPPSLFGFNRYMKEIVKILSLALSYQAATIIVDLWASRLGIGVQMISSAVECMKVKQLCHETLEALMPPPELQKPCKLLHCRYSISHKCCTPSQGLTTDSRDIGDVSMVV